MVFIEAQSNKTNVFLNEPIEVNYVVYYDPRIKIESNMEYKPKFSGFWAQIENTENELQQIQVSGRVYYAKLFKKAILYPQKTGKLVIDPLVLQLAINYPTGETSFIGMEEYNVVERKISTNSTNINVNALPEKGKPKDFKGAVGNFKFDVLLDKNNLKTGETLNLEVVVSGNGNLKLFDLPKPNLPSFFEIFEPNHKEEIAENINGISGKISDTYQIVPKQKGVFSLQEQQFSFFDPNTKSYKTINSPKINLNVSQGEASVVANVIQNNTSAQKINTIETQANWETNNFSFLKKWPSSIILLLPFLCYPMFFMVRKNTNNEEKPINKKTKTKHNFLEKSVQNVNNNNQFYSILETELNAFFSQKYHVENNAMLKQNLFTTLSQSTVSEENKNQIAYLYNQCEIAKYAPYSLNNNQLDLELAQKIINILGTK